MKLIFVYNADSSIFDQIKDAIHKSISPNSYQCNLCGLTYGAVSIKNEWKKFISKLSVKTDFLYKDEFRKNYPGLKDVQLPAVFSLNNDQLNQLISAEEINQQRTLKDLENLVMQKSMSS